jgi:hypothetical protein
MDQVLVECSCLLFYDCELSMQKNVVKNIANHGLVYTELQLT